MESKQIVELYARRGHIAYDGEGISQLQHGWQCGRLAAQAGASPALQLAAWLHDLGHLLSDLEGSPTTRGINDGHEQTAAAVLTAAYGDAVAQPVALHVQAKRYLVGTRPAYRQSLSADSIRSLQLQGGPMDLADATIFSALPYAQDAVRLRAWDDLAKRADLHPPSTAAALEELTELMDTVSRQTA